MRSLFVFVRQNLRWVAGGFLLCFFSSIGQTFFIALSGGHIRDEYGLSNGQFGGLYMLATLGSAMTLPFLGRIVDRISVSHTVLIVMPVLVAAGLLMSASHSVVLLGFTLYLLRLFGQGMMTHTSLTAMGRWFTRQRGRAVSLAILGHQTAEGLLPLLMVMLFATVGWRASWQVFAVLLLFVMPVVFSLMRTERVPEAPDPSHARAASRHWNRKEVLSDPLFWLILIGTLAPSFIGTTVFFHQAYLVELRGWPPEAFASAFMVMAVMTMTFSLISGWLIDRFGSARVLPVFLVPLSLSCFALALIEEPVGIYLFMALMGISYGITSTLFGALWPEVYGTANLGSVRSVTVAMSVFATALGPGLTGVLIDLNVSYLSQVWFMGVYCIAACAIMLWVSRRLMLRAATPA